MNLGSSNSLMSSNNSRNSRNSNNRGNNNQMTNVFTGNSRNNKTSYGGHDFDLVNSILTVNRNGRKSQTVLTNGSNTYISSSNNGPPKFNLFQSDESFAKASNDNGNLVLYGLLYSHMNPDDSTDSNSDNDISDVIDNLKDAITENGEQLFKVKFINDVFDDLDIINKNMGLNDRLSVSGNFQSIIMKLAILDKLITDPHSSTGSSGGIKTTYYPGLQWVAYPLYYNENLSSLNVLLNASNVDAWTKTSVTGLTNPGIYKGNSYNFTSLNTSTTSTNTSGLNAFGNGQQYYTVVWTGYFKPNVTGQWIFTTTSDDGSYLWVNSDQASPITSFSTFSPTNLPASGITVGSSSNATVKNGNTHGQVTVSGVANFTSGKSYPIIVLYGQYNGGFAFTMTLTDPNGVKYTSNLNTLLFNTISN